MTNAEYKSSLTQDGRKELDQAYLRFVDLVCSFNVYRVLAGSNVFRILKQHLPDDTEQFEMHAGGYLVVKLPRQVEALFGGPDALRIG